MHDPSTPESPPGSTGGPQRRVGVKTLMVLVATCAVVLAAGQSIRDQLRPAYGPIRLLGSSDPEQRRDGARDLASLPPAEVVHAIPALLAVVADPDELFRQNVLEALARAARSAAPDLDQRGEFRAAVQAVTAGLNDRAEPIRRDAVRFLVGYLQARIADPAPLAAALARAALNDRSIRVREEAANGLLLTAEQSSIAAPAHLGAAVAEPDRPGDIRGVAAVLLGAFPADRPAAFDPLVAALGDPDPRVRRGAAAGLALLGPEAIGRAVGPLLVALVDRRDPPGGPSAGLAIRWRAFPRTLVIEDQAVRPIMPVDDPSGGPWDPVGMAVVALGVAAAAEFPDDRAVEALARTLQGENPEHRRAAASALSFLGSKASQAGPALVEALDRAIRDPDRPSINGPSIFNDLITALADIAPGTPLAPGAVALLTRALGDPSWYTSTAAARALGRFGPAAAPALPQLRKLARREFSGGDPASEAIELIEQARSIQGRAPPSGSGR